MNIDRQAWLGEEVLAEPRPDMFRAQQLQVSPGSPGTRGRGLGRKLKRRGQIQGRNPIVGGRMRVEWVTEKGKFGCPHQSKMQGQGVGQRAVPEAAVKQGLEAEPS